MDHKQILNYLKEEVKNMEGTYIEYDESSVMLSVPVEDVRFQNVKVYLEDRGSRLKISFMSKVCSLDEYESGDFHALLVKSHDYDYARIIIHNDEIQVYASEIYDRATFDHCREMFMEVARQADKLERDFTGEDIN